MNYLEKFMENGKHAATKRAVSFLGDPMLSDRCLSLSPVCLSVCPAYNLRGQTAGSINMKIGIQVGFCPGHIVLHGDPAPAPPKGHSTQFSADMSCGQMAAWIKMPLGIQVGLGPGDFVLGGNPTLHPQKG